MTPALPASVVTGNVSFSLDPIRDIADRISRLSYGDMKRLADELNGINVKHSSFSWADGLYEWSRKTLGTPHINMIGR